MPSLKQHAGYLQIDHRDSPGLTPADVAHVPGGHAIAVPGGTQLEADTQTCSHCQRGILLRPDRERQRGYCPKCDHYICDLCAGVLQQTGVCRPMAQVLDLAQDHLEHFTGREDDPQAAELPRILLTDVFDDAVDTV